MEAVTVQRGPNNALASNLTISPRIAQQHQSFAADPRPRQDLTDIRFNDLHLPLALDESPARIGQQVKIIKTNLNQSTKATPKNIQISFINGQPREVIDSSQLGPSSVKNSNKLPSTSINSSGGKQNIINRNYTLHPVYQAQQSLNSSKLTDSIQSRINRSSKLREPNAQKYKNQLNLTQNLPQFSERAQNQDQRFLGVLQKSTVGNLTIQPDETEFEVLKTTSAVNEQSQLHNQNLYWDPQNQTPTPVLIKGSKRRNKNYQQSTVSEERASVVRDITIPTIQVTGSLSLQQQLTVSQTPKKDDLTKTKQGFLPQVTLTTSDMLNQTARARISANKTTQGHSMPPASQQPNSTKNSNQVELKASMVQRTGRAESSFNKTNNLNEESVILVQSTLKQTAKKNYLQESKTFPLKSSEALKFFYSSLSPYEKEEIKGFETIYYLNLHNKHSTTSGRRNEEDLKRNNYGFDGEDDEYLYESGDQLNYRYEIVKKLGKGAFGIVLKCVDHRLKEVVAMKILKNKKKLHTQGKIEIQLLETLRDSDPKDSFGVVRIKDSFTFRNHVCLSFEMLNINLYQFIKNNDFKGFSIALAKRFTIQILEALEYLARFKIVHCDLKPENVLLRKANKSGVKLIDFGSSCYEADQFFTYIQSRFYRAPEIMLGISYTPAIDMWSLGCMVFEFLAGVPLFTGENERDQMAAIMEVSGLPPRSLIAKASRRKIFFDDDYNPIIKLNSRGKLRKPGSKPLDQILNLNDPVLIDFMKGCFEWKPELRLTPDKGLFMFRQSQDKLK